MSQSSTSSAPATDAKFEAMVDSLSTDGGSAKERRTNKRFRIDRMVPATLFHLAGCPRMEIKLCDVSVTGAGIMSRRVFQVGEQFAVGLEVKGTASKLVLCEARSCKYASKGLYRAGIKFLAATADPERRGQVPAMWIRRYARTEATA